MSGVFIGDRVYSTLVAAIEDASAPAGDVVYVLTGCTEDIQTFCMEWVEIPLTQDTVLSLPGSICEECFDALATQLQEAPWGGEMGVCQHCSMTKEGV